jgi:hypothetical protein
MKKYNSIFFLLFILLVMGAFASMAQNSYGMKIMGAVAFIFGFIFLIELITSLRKKENLDVYSVLELAGLFILSVIFGLRVFYIHFSYIEVIFAAVAIMLAVIYLRKMIIRFRHFNYRNRTIAQLVLAFHLSVILFLVSLALLPFYPTYSTVVGALALVLLIVFFIIGISKKNLLVDGEKISAFVMVRQLKDHSIIIVFLFLLFSFYLVFNRLNLLPGIYSDEFPRAYYKLVNDASSKKEKPVDGKYKHEEFMEKYRQFLENNKTSKR